MQRQRLVLHASRDVLSPSSEPSRPAACPAAGSPVFARWHPSGLRPAAASGRAAGSAAAGQAACLARPAPRGCPIPSLLAARLLRTRPARQVQRLVGREHPVAAAPRPSGPSASSGPRTAGPPPRGRCADTARRRRRRSGCAPQTRPSRRPRIRRIHSLLPCLYSGRRRACRVWTCQPSGRQESLVSAPTPPSGLRQADPHVGATHAQPPCPPACSRTHRKPTTLPTSANTLMSCSSLMS